jgi:hypothetical protein
MTDNDRAIMRQISSTSESIRAIHADMRALARRNMDRVREVATMALTELEAGTTEGDMQFLQLAAISEHLASLSRMAVQVGLRAN